MSGVFGNCRSSVSGPGRGRPFHLEQEPLGPRRTSSSRWTVMNAPGAALSMDRLLLSAEAWLFKVEQRVPVGGD